MAKPAILIVDDREENLLALERLLEQTEAVIVKAQNGNDALKACLHHEFALALLDVNMPEMNGYELAELMRGERIHSMVPIIFVTAAYRQEEQIFKGYSAGGVDYLVKPLQAEILLSKVKVFLDIYRQKQEIIQLNTAMTVFAEQLAVANQGLRTQSNELRGSMEEIQAAEQKLRAAHGRINTILGQMSDGFVSFDRDWRCTQINTAAAKMLQMAPEQLTGKTVEEIWPQAFDLPIGANFRRSLQENIPLQFEMYYPAPLERWLECRCQPTTEGLAAFFNDITERRQLEAESSKARNLESLGILAGGIAHDFNNLFQVLLGNISLAKMQIPESSEAFGFLSSAEKAYQQGTELTSRLLAFSSGTFSTRDDIQPAELIRKTVLAQAAGATGLELDFALANAPERISVDVGQLEQVIRHLTMNAMEAMPAGGRLRGAGCGWRQALRTLLRKRRLPLLPANI
ncbi:MAG: hypothetical protein A2512_01705 [Deltaproteobacteria bacterium RIFOXYD12_FULL_56_24]|nr:MAG: hypothetical protein A2512_01705 [Deltaproteobacteria bacterium RIFOXYD12_FULL_56_24]